MRRTVGWLTAFALLVAACGGSDDSSGDPTEAPRIVIGGVSVGADGAAVLEYSFDDDGPVRVEIDWGDGSPLQGFTGAAGSFTSRHVYDTEVTSVVVTVVTTDAEGNSSAITRSVDLAAATTTPSTTASSTSMPSAASSSTTVAATSTTTTTTTTTAPPPPPPPDPTTTTSTTTTTTTTTTLPPRRFSISVEARRIDVRGDCDGGLGGPGEFRMRGYVDTSRSERVTFEFGVLPDPPRKLNDGDTIDVSSYRSTSTPVVEGRAVEWSAALLVAEEDAFGFDPDMDNEETVIRRSIDSARNPVNETIQVGSGSCRVDMTVVVNTERVTDVGG